MQDLLQEFQAFNSNTKTDVLNSWAKRFDKIITKLNENEKGYYYLLLSEFNAIYLRNIAQAKNMLKSIRNPRYPLSEQIKVRRCFYKYLEGDYQNATQSLQELSANRIFSSQQIIKDFFSRIYFRDNYSSFGKNKVKNNRKQSYQIEFLKAIRQERKGSLKLAVDIHRQIIANYGDLNQTIQYESAEHILMLFKKEGVKSNKQEIEKYTDIVQNYKDRLENKVYYKQKIEFIMKVMDVIENQGDEQEQLRRLEIAKEFMIDKLKKAIAEEDDEETLQKFKSVLNALKQSKTSGEEVCLKFMGDRQIFQISKLKDKKTQSKVKIKETKMSKILDESSDQQKKIISKISKTPIKSKNSPANNDSEYQEEAQASKMKKTPLQPKASKMAEEEQEDLKPKSKKNSESYRFNRDQEQSQQYENTKSKLKNQNQQKYSKMSRLPDSIEIGKNSKYNRYKQQQVDQSQLENIQFKSKIKGKEINQTKMKRTESRLVQRVQIDPDFKGSNMTKVNYNSGGYQERYFYMKQDFEQSMKLFFCSKKQKMSSSDQYYRLRGLKKITYGKKSDAFKRSQCEDFPSQLCFTLYISTSEQDYQRNFYVKQKEDYQQWIKIFQFLLSKKEMDKMKMKSKFVMG